MVKYMIKNKNNGKITLKEINKFYSFRNEYNYFKLNVNIKI